MGNSGSGGGFQMSYTIGEAIIYTQTQPVNVLTQGFQQPDINCDAQAGTLTAVPLDEEDCIEPGNRNPVTISAEINNDQVIPDGYSVIYLLAQDTTQTIVSTSPTPSFDVSEPGTYSIHTLVYNADPTAPDFLDLGIIAFGQVSISQLLDRITETPICASLDEEGVTIEVLSCDCNVSTGTLTANPLTAEDCLDPDIQDNLQLSAELDGNAIIPNGYIHVFYLTREQGGGEIILAENDSPEFFVDATGTYRIYSLVYFPVEGDTNFLDLSFLELGITDWQTFQGRVNGQAVCFNIDTEGVSFIVNECIVCDASAGTLTLIPLGTEDCIDPGIQDNVVVTATPNGDDEIPQGYELSYLLVDVAGQTLLDIQDDPQFTISTPGSYAIFPIVYTSNPNDTNFLDLSLFPLGSSNLTQIESFIADNTICADIADNGLSFQIPLCECEASFTSLTPVPLNDDCLDESNPMLTIMADVSATIPPGYEELYFLSSDDSAPILGQDQGPEFEVDMVGIYTIYGLIYDPGTFSVDFIVTGQTSIEDIRDAVAAQSICLDFSDVGAVFTVEECVVDGITCDGLEIPTIFTPGNNGFNDTWEIRNFSGQANVKVFDRWGGLMYDGPFPWNGTKDNDNTDVVPRGTYYFLFEISQTGEICKGAITVIPDNL